VLIPSIGMSGTIYVAMAHRRAALCVRVVVDEYARTHTSAAPSWRNEANRVNARGVRTRRLACDLVLVSRFAALVRNRVDANPVAVLGPTTYAFAATLAAVIAGVAIGSGIGAWLYRRARTSGGHAGVHAVAAAVTASWTYAAAGSRIR
jgi:hypothetical protein